MRTTWTEQQALELHDEMLRECTDSIDGTVNICGLRYDAVTAFKKLDPIAYDQSFLCWIADQGMEWDDKEEVYFYESWNEAPYA